MAARYLGKDPPRLADGRRAGRPWRRWLKAAVPSRLVLYRVRTNRPAAFLTFDDGPDETWTPMVLDILREHRARATFFVVGSRAAAHPTLIRQMVAAGHTIGGHGFHHVALSRIDRVTRDREIDDGHDAVARAGGGRVHFFRPPYGELNPKILVAAWRRRLQVTMWSHDVANRVIDEPAMAAEAFSTVPVTPGEIVLLHDHEKAVVPVLPDLLRSLHRSGFRAEPLARPGWLAP